jgi:hypothetical protein
MESSTRAALRQWVSARRRSRSAAFLNQPRIQ